jgi:hypothetical protein
MQASAPKFLVSSRPMLDDTHVREQHKQSLAVEVLRKTGMLRLAARGYSMLPTLWPGDVLTVEAQSFDQVRAGDVVLFAREDRFFIHRILRKDASSSGDYLITRGDAMPEEDAPVVAGELLGKVVTTERRDDGVAVPACSGLRRRVGLMLAHNIRLRSLALRWHAWRVRGRNAHSDLPAQEVFLG